MWSVLLTILIFIVSFSLLVLIHEFGHFWMAKRSGMKVEEFGMGLPPRIWGKKVGETLYSINWIPFGGFVRIYGEDSSDPKMLRSKRSFVGRPLRQRIAVVIAGVVMNFLLAILLMSVAFTAGMKPLLVSSDEVFQAISDGQIVVEPGLVVKEVTEGGLAERSGIQAGDKLVDFAGEGLVSSSVEDLLDDEKGKEGTYSFARGEMMISFDKLKEEELGVNFKGHLVGPRVAIYDLNVDDYLSEIGLMSGDVILQVNGREVFSAEDFRSLSYEAMVAGEVEYLFLRDGKVDLVEDNFAKVNRVIISEVMEDSAAEEAGLMTGDIVQFIDNKEVESVRSFQELTAAQKPGKRVSVLLEREGEVQHFVVVPEEGRMGVVISNLATVNFPSNAELYTKYLYSTVVEEKVVKYPWYEAPGVALEESYSLAKMSVVSFGSMIKGVFSGEGVPSTVGGPVKIAYLTHLSLQDGWVDFLRLMALISLGLAVLNILPVPALDGGRLLFLIIEGVTGRRVSSKFEMYVHAAGFLLLISLIGLITYSDIVSLL